MKSVSYTRIFARPAEGGRQFIVYSMKLESSENLAMVLPLPVKPGTGENGVTFINLKEYPGFFDDMENGFPKPPPPQSDSSSRSLAPLAVAAALAVVQVGDFEASFVPTEDDFSRLDARFRLPAGSWNKLPQYKTYGFAVFKLKPGLQQLHPMAFSFPRRDVASLFFPPVHIHDGKVHAKADFDHLLYSQPREGEPFKYNADREWTESAGHARNFMKPALTQGIVDADQHCYKTEMHGDLPNRDTIVELET